MPLEFSYMSFCLENHLSMPQKNNKSLQNQDTNQNLRGRRSAGGVGPRSQYAMYLNDTTNVFYGDQP